MVYHRKRDVPFQNHTKQHFLHISPHRKYSRSWWDFMRCWRYWWWAHESKIIIGTSEARLISISIFWFPLCTFVFCVYDRFIQFILTKYNLNTSIIVDLQWIVYEIHCDLIQIRYREYECNAGNWFNKSLQFVRFLILKPSLCLCDAFLIEIHADKVIFSLNKMNVQLWIEFKFLLIHNSIKIMTKATKDIVALCLWLQWNRIYWIFAESIFA